MLSKSLEKILNNQVKLEGDSSQIYLAMASWAENQGFEGIATFESCLSLTLSHVAVFVVSDMKSTPSLPLSQGRGKRLFWHATFESNSSQRYR